MDEILKSFWIPSLEWCDQRASCVSMTPIIRFWPSFHAFLCVNPHTVCDGTIAKMSEHPSYPASISQNNDKNETKERATT